MKTVSFYIADTEFKSYFCELVDQQYPESGPSHFVTFTPRIESVWNNYPWESRTILPWISGKNLSRQYNLAARLRRIQSHFAEHCRNADQINLHTYQIFSERVNCVIAHLKKEFPHASIRVRLIPDGILNLRRRPMVGWRRFPQWFNRVKWAGYSDISPFCYSGDRLGADAAICDRIYLPNNFPSEYDPQKIYFVEMPTAEHSKSTPTRRKALILGTIISTSKRLPARCKDNIAARISRLLSDLNVDQSIYKPHPAEPRDALTLWSPGQTVLETQLCLERLVVEQAFDVVVGCSSTGLLMSKIIQPNLEVYSVGLDALEYAAKCNKSLHGFRTACTKLGIATIPIAPNGHESAPSPSSPSSSAMTERRGRAA